MEFRHIGITVKDFRTSIPFYEKMGFKVSEQGNAFIDGVVVRWVKMKHKSGFILELLINGAPHIAVTVESVDKTKYYYQAPAGHKIQYDRAPDGMLVEMVEEQCTKDIE